LFGLFRRCPNSGIIGRLEHVEQSAQYACAPPGLKLCRSIQFAIRSAKTVISWTLRSVAAHEMPPLKDQKVWSHCTPGMVKRSLILPKILSNFAKPLKVRGSVALRLSF
jgi:hypothetical protein